MGCYIITVINDYYYDKNSNKTIVDIGKYRLVDLVSERLNM